MRLHSGERLLQTMDFAERLFRLLGLVPEVDGHRACEQLGLSRQGRRIACSNRASRREFFQRGRRWRIESLAAEFELAIAEGIGDVDLRGRVLAVLRFFHQPRLDRIADRLQPQHGRGLAGGDLDHLPGDWQQRHAYHRSLQRSTPVCAVEAVLQQHVDHAGIHVDHQSRRVIPCSNSAPEFALGNDPHLLPFQRREGHYAIQPIQKLRPEFLLQPPR